MEKEYIQKILEQTAQGKISPREAYDDLKNLPYGDFDYVKPDYHRTVRTGFPEVIFCPGKTSMQIAEIAERLFEKNGRVMATRASFADYEAVKGKLPAVVYHERARIISAEREPLFYDADVAVVTAGTADIPVAEEAAVSLKLLSGIDADRIYDVGVSGLHRLLDKLDEIRKADVVIAVAGMEGALPSVLGGLVEVPVIAVPTSVGYGSSFEGLSALLGMLNSCANGIATVNIDNGYGAAYVAAQICRGKKG